ncbi:GNAT family protein [Streptomyces scabichelini]|uniref:GNAT family N-acetyltransferase n=1 Tax=Streptomyces scabichelini TaxID=2711217 RepID=UPI0030B9E476
MARTGNGAARRRSPGCTRLTSFLQQHGPGAFHKDTGALVGSYCLTLVSRGVWELGYRAVKELRGRGYSVEAARALCDWGWVTLDVHRIERWAMAGNTGSCAVAEKLGFTVERTLRSRSIADEGKPHG